MRVELRVTTPNLEYGSRTSVEKIRTDLPTSAG